MAATGDLDGLKSSLESDQLNVNAKDEYGFTFLHLAADRGGLALYFNVSKVYGS
jgi:ankyrin repeat protein